MGLSGYFRLEARSAASLAQLIGLGAGLAMVAATSLLLPRMPASLIGFLERVFDVRDMAEVLLMNDYLALDVVLFWVGAADLLGVVLQPREERMLDVLLSKPVTRAQFLAARTLPVLAATVASGLSLTAATVAAVAPWLEGSRQTPAMIAAAGAWATLAVLVQLALLGVVLVVVRESFHGLLVAFVVWMAPLVGMTLAVYRPDVLAERSRLLVYPANLVWYGPKLAAALALGAPLLVGAAAALLAVQAWVFRRAELR